MKKPPPKRKVATRKPRAKHGDTWQLQEAKNQFSEVVRRAEQAGPQRITRHGKVVAQVVAVKGFQMRAPKKNQSIVEFFRNSPLYGVELDMSCDHRLPREVEL